MTKRKHPFAGKRFRCTHEGCRRHFGSPGACRQHQNRDHAKRQVKLASGLKRKSNSKPAKPKPAKPKPEPKSPVLVTISLSDAAIQEIIRNTPSPLLSREIGMRLLRIG